LGLALMKMMKSGGASFLPWATALKNIV